MTRVRVVRRAALVIAGFSALVLASSTPARSDDPVTSAVRFNREIVRIFQRKCLPCHAPGAISMSLATHRDARPWARAIREEIVEQRMPPWSAARGSVRFTDDIGLTPRELTTILTWVDGGMPKGDDADLPAAIVAPPAAHAPADLTLALPPQTIPGSGADLVRRVTVPTGLLTDRWVRQVRIQPGERRQLRAAFASIIAPAGRSRPADSGAPALWVAAWTPWQPAIVPPDDGAFLVRAGARVAVELHYRASETPAEDRSALEIVFAETGDSHASSNLVLDAASPASPTRRTGIRALDRATTLWAMRPQRLSEGQSLEVTATAPDGTVQVLLWIPRYRAEWPAPFVLTHPVRLPQGTRLRVTVTGRRPAPGAGAVLAVHF
jgi:hypothetical protein